MGFVSVDETVAGVKVVDVTGMKLTLVENEAVAGVKSTFLSNLSAFVLGVEKSVNGVSKALLFAVGDQFSSPSLQHSFSGLDWTTFDMSLFAFCDVRSGEGVCGIWLLNSGARLQRRG